MCIWEPYRNIHRNLGSEKIIYFYLIYPDVRCACLAISIIINNLGSSFFVRKWLARRRVAHHTNPNEAREASEARDRLFGRAAGERSGTVADDATEQSRTTTFKQQGEEKPSCLLAPSTEPSALERTWTGQGCMT
eukprot:3317411-Pleurochrysis_carterae.AAC.1